MLAQRFKDTLNLFLPIKGQKIDLIPFLNALNEAEVLNSVSKEFHNFTVEGKNDCLNFSVRHEKRVKFSPDRNERHVLLSTVSGSNSTRYAGDIHLKILNSICISQKQLILAKNFAVMELGLYLVFRQNEIDI